MAERWQLTYDDWKLAAPEDARSVRIPRRRGSLRSLRMLAAVALEKRQAAQVNAQGESVPPCVDNQN